MSTSKSNKHPNEHPPLAQLHLRWRVGPDGSTPPGGQAHSQLPAPCPVVPACLPACLRPSGCPLTVRPTWTSSPPPCALQGAARANHPSIVGRLTLQTSRHQAATATTARLTNLQGSTTQLTPSSLPFPPHAQQGVHQRPTSGTRSVHSAKSRPRARTAVHQPMAFPHAKRASTLAFGPAPSARTPACLCWRGQCAPKGCASTRPSRTRSVHQLPRLARKARMAPHPAPAPARQRINRSPFARQPACAGAASAPQRGAHRPRPSARAACITNQAPTVGARQGRPYGRQGGGQVLSPRTPVHTTRPIWIEAIKE